MSCPLVSILVPVYGVEKYMERCVRSLLGQTYTNIEYIFVDDCSPDRSMDILNQVAEHYPDKIIKVIRHEHNRGLAAARNTAVAAAAGEFLMHVDSDDWLELNAVEALVQKQLETNADIVSGNAFRHSPNGTEILAEPDYANKAEMIHGTMQMTIGHVLWRRLIRTSLYKANCISAVEGVNIGEDHYTLPRLVYHSKSFAKIDNIVYHYNNLNNNSYTARKKVVEPSAFAQNIESLSILDRFFADKDKSYADDLKKIRDAYIFHTLKMVRRSDRSAYKEIIDNYAASAPPYWKLKTTFILRKIYRKLTRR